MKHELTKEEIDLLLPCINRVLETGVGWEMKTLHHPVEAIVKALLSIPGMKRAKLEDGRYGVDGFDTNGWQWDWWQEFRFKGNRYTLSGSGYYGGHSFHLSDE